MNEIKDIELFNNISKKYIFKDINPCSSIARKQRLNRSISNISLSNKNILEIGCGAGFTVKYLDSSYKSYTGIDYSNELIDYAIDNFKGGKVDFQCINANKIEFNKKFDIIIAIGVIHHMDKPESIVQIILNYLKEDGVFVINEPVKESIFLRLLRKIRSNFDSNYSSDQTFYTKREYIKILSSKNYCIDKIFYQGILSTPFAEVIFKNKIFYYLCFFLILIENILERNFSFFTKSISWNIVLHIKHVNEKNL